MTDPKYVSGPVRKIGMNTRSVVGVMPDGARFESTLERDFMELVRFDKNIKLYTPQPLVIEYRDAAGKLRRYTPDGFIEYRRDIRPAKEMPHVLCEIKYRKDFRAQWRNLLPKFRAAKRYCAERGWEFKVFTEREIRTPYLQNVRFLWPYCSEIRDDAVVDLLLLHLAELRETDPEALLCSLFRDRWKRADALPDLWHLVATSQVGCDLTQPLTMKTHIWSLSDYGQP
ncbi:TnsA endonuclease-like protein [Sulfuritortus calidifontis]|uniref:TnsA endonuclease-like protein n=1 Tax=Sulfuritortus calidifontis TaxID=1914471 RepID=A0A4R3JY99_9PROT|nr:TnsA endonuclease N-terminal domain-containing protein [Sulfuritortus calidifontis]TCS72150.1 TnsA endonuclease-like protein [Sulfuritortus calidifontis]